MTNQIKLTAHGMRTAIGPSCSLLPFNPDYVLYLGGPS